MTYEGGGLRLLLFATVVKSDQFVGLLDRNEYNAAIFHTGELIEAAVVLLSNNFHAQSLFLSITAFEEIAKIKAGFARSWGEEAKHVSRSKDPLFRHEHKHKIAIDPIYLIGDRLADSIGKDRINEIFNGWASGEYSSLREQSLYFSRDSQQISIPAVLVTKKLAAEHLLIAIEIFSDEFWGMTGEAAEVCEKIDKYYSTVESVVIDAGN